MRRVYRACSNRKNFHDSMEKVNLTRQRNQYPPKFYERIISNIIEKLAPLKKNQKNQLEDAKR